MKTTTTGAAAGAAVLDDLRAALEARATADDGLLAQARIQGDETAAIIAALDGERDIVAGALVQPLIAGGHLARADAVAMFGEAATVLAEELGRLGEFRAGA